MLALFRALRTPFNTPSLHFLLTHPSIYPITLTTNLTYQPTLLTHPINLPFQPTLPMRLPLYQHFHRLSAGTSPTPTLTLTLTYQPT